MAAIVSLVRSYVRQGQRFWQCDLDCGHAQWVDGRRAVAGYHLVCNDCAEATIARRNAVYAADRRQQSLFPTLPHGKVKLT